MNKSDSPELATETGQQTKQPAKISKTPEPSKAEVVPMTNEQILEAQDKAVAEAYALVQAIENEKIARQRVCWKEISKVAEKYGFKISASHKPINVEIDINLIPIQ